MLKNKLSVYFFLNVHRHVPRSYRTTFSVNRKNNTRWSWYTALRYRIVSNLFIFLFNLQSSFYLSSCYYVLFGCMTFEETSFLFHPHVLFLTSNVPGVCSSWLPSFLNLLRCSVFVCFPFAYLWVFLFSQSLVFYVKILSLLTCALAFIFRSDVLCR